MAAAKQAAPQVETFCLTLAYTGARISEVLALTPRRIDYSVRGITFECLKKRKTGIFRTIPVPDSLLERLDQVHGVLSRQASLTLRDKRIWLWCRTSAWRYVKDVMEDGHVVGTWAVPKALRHGFAVFGTTDANVPLNVIQRWLGHARIETTAIYAEAIGEEERKLAKRMWL